MCARYLFRVDLTLNRAIHRPFCHFDFENESLVIIDQQKVGFMLIFAA